MRASNGRWSTSSWTTSVMATSPPCSSSPVQDAATSKEKLSLRRSGQGAQLVLPDFDGDEGGNPEDKQSPMTPEGGGAPTNPEQLDPKGAEEEESEKQKTGEVGATLGRAGQQLTSAAGNLHAFPVWVTS